MTGSEAPYDILVVGGCGVDTVVRVDRLAVPVGDSLGVPPIREQPGQTGGNVALGCRALGLSVKLIDFVGDDWAGSMLRERLARGGVDFEPLISPAGTRRAVNLVDRTGHRQSFYDGRDPDDLRMPGGFHRPHLQRARHVHLSISNFCRFLYDDIGALGLPVSTDLHDWDGRAEHQREFALRSDLVFLSAAKAGERVTDVMRGILRDGRAEAVVATAGASGAYVLVRGGAEPQHVPAAPPPAPVLDSNGAGDAFVCGFLYGRRRGLDAIGSARLGAVAGAHACTAEGNFDLVGASTLERALGAGSGGPEDGSLA